MIRAQLHCDGVLTHQAPSDGAFGGRRIKSEHLCMLAGNGLGLIQRAEMCVHDKTSLQGAP